MAHTVVGFFKNDSAAQSAAYNLQTAGFSDTDIDVADGSHYTDNTAGEKKADNGITRFFKNLFGDNDDDAERYATAGNEGYSIVTVHASSREEAQRAADLLDEYGAVDLDNRGQAYDKDKAYNSTDDSGATIQRVEEELQVGKQEVATGGVRLRSRIVDKPVEETLRLRRERVTVERQPVNRPLTDSDHTAFQDQDIELTERAEVPVVNKEARVVEEIKLTKEVDERSETIRDTVRHTEVDVDHIEDNSKSSDLNS